MSSASDASRQRSQRKKDHIDHFYKNRFEGNCYFDDVFLIHQALPEINFDEIDTTTEFLGKTIDFPIMINAMTGGFDGAVTINGGLAEVARRLNIPMAVGSQSIAVKDSDYKGSFKVVRDRIGTGIVVGNLSGFATLEEADIAVTMLEADGLQIHLNPAQEICMAEGDRDFRGVLANIEAIVRHLKVPVIVKEVGFGISEKVARQLYDVGVAYVDVAGSGGTNFIQIEDERNDEEDYQELYRWGIPTALSLLSCTAIKNRKGLIASGGISNASQIVKALIIGADMVGMSGPILRRYLDEREIGTYTFIKDLIHKTKIMMLLQGAADLQALKKTPYRITGELRKLLGEAYFVSQN